MSFNTQAYFSTAVFKYSNKGVQSGGFWNITHSSVLDPKYAGKGAFKKMTGMTWWDVKRFLNDLFLDPVDDPEIIERVKTITASFIPVRSGRLMQRLFESMKINRSQKSYTHYWANYSFKWSLKRPYPIPGQTSHAGELGYGEWGTVKLTEPEAIARVKVHHVTAGGNALYVLNDPLAIADPTVIIERVAQNELNNDYAEKFNLTLEIVL
jgi:hypothetical protein